MTEPSWKTTSYLVGRKLAWSRPKKRAAGDKDVATDQAPPDCCSGLLFGLTINYEAIRRVASEGVCHGPGPGHNYSAAIRTMAGVPRVGFT